MHRLNQQRACLKQGQNKKQSRPKSHQTALYDYGRNCLLQWNERIFFETILCIKKCIQSIQLSSLTLWYDTEGSPGLLLLSGDSSVAIPCSIPPMFHPPSKCFVLLFLFCNLAQGQTEDWCIDCLIFFLDIKKAWKGEQFLLKCLNISSWLQGHSAFKLLDE